MTALPKILLTLALGLFGFGCSAVVDADRAQCETTSDCRARGEAFENSVCKKNFCEVEVVDEWSCTEHGMLTSDSKKPISVDFSLFDAVSMNTVSGVEARLCRKLDLECAKPVAMMTTGSDGVVQFDVAPLFDGYVEVRRESYDTAMMFLPVINEPTSLGQFPYTEAAIAKLLGVQLGIEINPAAGRVLALVAGCDKQTTAGVSLVGENMGTEAHSFYAVNGFPSTTATETDSSGFAGYVNVAAGSITVNAELEDGRRIARTGLFIRPGWITMRRFQPWTD
ncbi:MAG TPA: hypothetical protein VJR89_23415 [Polyangiales bacterium]|nr:hypothetical protein [Polyangiales bacterium]